ncbi:MAG: twin-arginine translocase subunit TatC [Megasphaera micronuciformis]|nr:twin-arginine translocase subunit TatC [Megasphaera micronuciformis]MBF1362193.1 twin-arginine translocase subunit TatC [Megasphaera micronuciformis]
MTLKPDAQTEQPLRDHLQEFRKRLIICLVVVAIAALACYNYVDDIIALLSGPAGKLYFMNPSEVFFTYMEIALYTGILFTLPVLLYEVWAFVAPALWPEERRAVLVILPTAVILFYVGLVFAYYLVIPAAVTFFMGFATQTLQPMFSLESYLSFILALTLPFGFIFELPLIVVFLAKIGLVTGDFLKGKRKILIVIAFIFAAVVSPTTDIFTQTMIAVPLIVLYEISLFIVCKVMHK